MSNEVKVTSLNSPSFSYADMSKKKEKKEKQISKSPDSDLMILAVVTILAFQGIAKFVE
jgi:hypothetical protein